MAERTFKTVFAREVKAGDVILHPYIPLKPVLVKDARYSRDKAGRKINEITLMIWYGGKPAFVEVTPSRCMIVETTPKQ